MTIHIKAGDTLIGEVVVYEASKVTGPSLIAKSGKHRGLRGKLYNAKCVIQKPIRLRH
ncbi:MAG: hypothetical protein AOA65_2102 [Candidatus Bathyarchaeota archaeon BA1]|nr:MAG: hypothetical protein AOA65_2102 [Candidatus Bathyarchaeota archaeon BA1]